MENASPMPVELKATSLSELLDRTFTLYRNNFWLVCGIMVMPVVVMTLLSLVFVLFYPIRFTPAPVNPSNPFAAFAGLGPILLAATGVGLLRSVVYAFGLGCMTFAVSEIYLGRKTTIRQSYGAISRRSAGLAGLMLILVFIGFIFILVTVFAAGILGGLLGGVLTFVSPVFSVVIVFLAIIFGFFFGLWLMMRFAVSIPAYTLERRGVFDSMARSGVLTRGHRWRIFLACIVITLIVYVVQIVCTAPFSIMVLMHPYVGSIPMWLQVANAVSAGISTILASPLLMITLALIYYDVRIRKEAFDLETMMSALTSTDATSAGPGAPPPVPSA